jgi:hypothetical protein
VIAVSRVGSKSWSVLPAFPATRLIILTRWYPPSLYHLAAQPIRHPWFVHKDLPVIVSAGRLTRAKDYPHPHRGVCGAARASPGAPRHSGRGWTTLTPGSSDPALGRGGCRSAGVYREPLQLPGKRGPVRALLRVGGFAQRARRGAGPGHPGGRHGLPQPPRAAARRPLRPLVPVGDVHALAEAMARRWTTPWQGRPLKSAVRAYDRGERAPAPEGTGTGGRRHDPYGAGSRSRRELVRKGGCRRREDTHRRSGSSSGWRYGPGSAVPSHPGHSGWTAS